GDDMLDAGCARRGYAHDRRRDQRVFSARNVTTDARHRDQLLAKPYSGLDLGLEFPHAFPLAPRKFSHLPMRVAEILLESFREALIAAHVSVFTPPPASALSAFKGSFRGELGINADAAPTRNHGVGFRKSGRRSRSGRRRAVRSLRAGWTAISARRTWLGARK